MHSSCMQHQVIAMHFRIIIVIIIIIIIFIIAP
jgi:hypothetical protein